MNLLQQMLDVTDEDKFNGLWFSVDGNLYKTKPENFTGLYLNYCGNGRLYEHSFYEKGKLHGEFKWYDEDGRLRTHYFFEKGKRHGEYKWYDENGRLREHSFFEKGKRHGEYKWYDENGRLRTHCFYKNNKLIKNYLE